MTSPQVQDSEAGSTPDELAHYVCPCDEDLALCGTDVALAVWAEEHPHQCVVCTEMQDLPCRRCGR